MAAMVAGLAMGLAGLAYYVPRLVRSPRVLLVVDDRGFEDNASAMAAGRVEWTEVIDLALVRIHGRDNIAAKVTNPALRVERWGCVVMGAG